MRFPWNCFANPNWTADPTLRTTGLVLNASVASNNVRQILHYIPKSASFTHIKSHFIRAAQGQVTLAKMAKNLPHLWYIHKKMKPKTNNFFHCKLEDAPSLLVWIAL